MFALLSKTQISSISISKHSFLLLDAIAAAVALILCSNLSVWALAPETGRMGSLVRAAAQASQLGAAVEDIEVLEAEQERQIRVSLDLKSGSSLTAIEKGAVGVHSINQRIDSLAHGHLRFHDKAQVIAHFGLKLARDEEVTGEQINAHIHRVAVKKTLEAAWKSKKMDIRQKLQQAQSDGAETKGEFSEVWNAFEAGVLGQFPGTSSDLNSDKGYVQDVLRELKREVKKQPFSAFLAGARGEVLNFAGFATSDAEGLDDFNFDLLGLDQADINTRLDEDMDPAVREHFQAKGTKIQIKVASSNVLASNGQTADGQWVIALNSLLFSDDLKSADGTSLRFDSKSIALLIRNEIEQVRLKQLEAVNQGVLARLTGQAADTELEAQSFLTVVRTAEVADLQQLEADLRAYKQAYNVWVEDLELKEGEERPALFMELPDGQKLQGPYGNNIASLIDLLNELIQARQTGALGELSIEDRAQSLLKEMTDAEPGTPAHQLGETIANSLFALKSA